jgi:glycosyltransferase involved in cell wall biosynthesis
VKILISAYRCAPHRGSEPGAGWNWSLAAAAENDVWVLTREKNRIEIEAELELRPNSRLRVVYVELPAWGLRLKKGERGIRYFSYYALWQYAALRRARRLHDKVRFDLVHHVTFGNMWLPALASFIEAPFVLGPVGGGPRVPLQLFPELGVVGAVREVARLGLQVVSRFNPLTRATWRRAKLIIVQNQETRNALPRIHRPRVVIRPHTSLSETGPPSTGTTTTAAEKEERGPIAVLAGRLVPWKGGTLALRAIARTSEWSLTIIGDGPDRKRLITLVGKLNLNDRVTFIPWLSQAELWEAMLQADALLLPSLRDDAPFVVGEAQALGLPVVAFDQAGPRELALFTGSTVITVPLHGGDPAGALAEGLRRTRLGNRAQSKAAYEIPTISGFLATAYSAITTKTNGC